MMLLERYLTGEFQQVWQELSDLGEKIWKEPQYTEAREVALATMERLRFNLEQVIQNARSMGLEFASFDGDGSESSVEGLFQHEPLLLQQEDQRPALLEAESILHCRIPLAYQAAIQTFAKIDLRLSFQSEEVDFLDALCFSWGDVEYVEAQYENWLDEKEELEDEALPLVLEFSPDLYHKDNVSGSGGYGIDVRSNPADPLMVFATPVQGFEGQTLLDYLRWCMRFGGIPGFQKMPEAFRHQLTAGLLPF